MLTCSVRLALSAFIAGMLGAPLAHADIYTWVDASGTVNVSNLEPPEGASVTKVTHEAPKQARDDAARAASREAEVKALQERVAELENQVDVGRSPPMPPPLAYAPRPPPTIIEYVTEPPVVQYVNTPPPANQCDATWIDCGPSWVPGIYPAAVFVGRPGRFRRFHPDRDEHRFAVHQSMRMAGGFHRG